MWALIAEYSDIYQEKIGGPFLDHYSEEIVALFSSFEAAAAYRAKSLLKHPKRRNYGSDVVFRQRSLLRAAEGARIEEYEEPSYPIDPEL